MTASLPIEPILGTAEGQLRGMKTSFRRQGWAAVVGFESGPLLPMIGAIENFGSGSEPTSYDKRTSANRVGTSTADRALAHAQKGLSLLWGCPLGFTISITIILP